jgi:branched-chain amino acid aminotransferase
MGINRAFVYGDLLFETIRMQDGVLQNVALHTKRLELGAKVLGFDLPSNWDENYLHELVFAAVKGKDARIRLVVSRQGNGFYLPNNNDVRFYVEYWTLMAPRIIIDRIDVFEEQYKSCSSLSNLKSGNALVYVLASQYAAHNNLDDVLILNQHGRIAEATSSNVFWIKNGIIYTPPLTEGPVAGIMREVVIKQATEQGLMVQEKELTIEELLLTDECFLTNALNGITLVNQFRDKKFEHELGSVLQRDIK